MPLSSWPSTCSCEKLEQLLVRLGTTLINRVDEGTEEGGVAQGEAWVLVLLVQSSEQLSEKPDGLQHAI